MGISGKLIDFITTQEVDVMKMSNLLPEKANRINRT